MNKKTVLIITEKPTLLKNIKEALEKRLGSLSKQNIFLYSIMGDKKPIFNMVDLRNKQKYCLSPMNELTAKYCSKKYFPFNPKHYNYSINNQKEFDNIYKLIQKSDIIINACDPDKIGNLLFSSLVFSGYFNVFNKKIKNMKLFTQISDEIFEAFLDLKNNFKETKKLKDNPPRLCNIEFEMAYNEIKWYKVDLNKNFEFSQKILKKYSLKYKINLFKMINLSGYFKNKKNKDVLDELIDNSFHKRKLIKQKKKNYARLLK